MSHIKIIEKINNEENTYIGEYNNNLIKYINKDSSIILDLKKNILIKENDESIVKLSFINEKNTKGIYLLKSINQEFILDIYTKTISSINNEFNVIYTISENDEINYKVIYKNY